MKYSTKFNFHASVQHKFYSRVIEIGMLGGRAIFIHISIFLVTVEIMFVQLLSQPKRQKNRIDKKPDGQKNRLDKKSDNFLI